MNKIPPKIFIYGFLLTMAGALSPVALFLYDWYGEFKAAPPGSMIWHQALLCGGGAAVLYWRKFKAQLELPPDWAEALSLAQQVKTTVQTVEQEGKATKTVTTLEETKLVLPPSAGDPPQDQK